MGNLKIGFNVFAGAAQTGTYEGSKGAVQVETAAPGVHRLQVQRLSDSYYWNDVSGAFQSGVPTEAQDIQIPGSEDTFGGNPTYRRLTAKLKDELVAGLTAAGVKFTAYAAGDTPATEGASCTLVFAL